MALIPKGGDRWEFQAEAGRDPLTGRRRRKSRTFTGTKRQAERAHALFLAETAAEERSADLTLAGLFVTWLEGKRDLSPTTRREYERMIDKRIVPALGRVKIGDLETWQLDRFYRALEASGLAPATIRQTHAVIGGALGQARKWRWVKENVAQLASPPSVRPRPPKVPTVGAVRLLIATALEYDPDMGTAVLLAAATGARRGELCALRWSDVNLDAGTVRIERSMFQAGELGGEKDTKTHAGRTVDVDDATVAALKLRREWQEERVGALMATPELPGRITPGPDATPATSEPRTAKTANHALGKRAVEVKLPPHAFILSQSLDGSEPMSLSKLTGFWARHRKRHGADGVRLHDLRHWSVSEALDQGHSPSAVAQRHGHASVKMTLDVYGHPADGRGKMIADGIGRALTEGS